MQSKYAKWFMWSLLLLLMLVAVSIWSVCTGPAGISVKEIVKLLFNPEKSNIYTIIFDIRMPRILLALAVGGALSISGVILQGMFRNPLVEPYTLGISGGAALGVCLSIVLNLGRFSFLSLPHLPRG